MSSIRPPSGPATAAGPLERPAQPPAQTLLFPDNDAAEPGPPANDPAPARRMRQEPLPIFGDSCPPPASPAIRTVRRNRQNRRS